MPPADVRRTALFPRNVVPDPAVLPEGFRDFLEPLHRLFTPWQEKLIRNRAFVLDDAACGKLPRFRAPLFDNPVTKGTWRIAVPEWAVDQRNQMTGPADDEELVVKMLNSGAPGVMLDLEDSAVNRWENLWRGIRNAVAALHGELAYAKNGRTVGIAPSKTVTFTRVRGLHVRQHGVFAEPCSASLFDAALLAYLVDPSRLKHPLCLYIPKSESEFEADWWNTLFSELEKLKGLPRGGIKCMALVESHPLAYRMEEFLYGLRERIIGLNLGRWDYMASLIHFTLHDPQWVLPDRNAIPHDVPFFQNLRELMVEVCHSRGALAIGGMTALYPSRTDAGLNARALEALRRDKANEAAAGMDGAWTGHPDQNAIAVAQFPSPNQLGFRRPEAPTRPDLRPASTGVGPVTLEGSRAAVRTTIRYRAGVLAGKGASLLDGYMEDLATDRIYRLMLAQRIRYGVPVDAPGGSRPHSVELIRELYRDETDRLVAALAPDDSSASLIRKAARLSLAMIENGVFDPE